MTASLWALVVWTAPLTAKAGVRAMAMAYVAGALICHQRPERSFHVAGGQLPVCARCTALYSGAAMGMCGWLLLRWRRRGMLEPTRAVSWLAASAAPAAISIAGSVSGWWDGTNALRAAMTFPFGIIVGAVTAAVAARDLR